MELGMMGSELGMMGSVVKEMRMLRVIRGKGFY
jgi:hypothetical protein